MKKAIIWIVVLVVIVIIIVSLAGGSKQSAQSNLVKIGVLSPMSGGKANLGQGLRQALLMAQKDFGSTTKEYQFVFEDSGGDVAKSASAVQKLVSVDKVNALVSITSQDGNIANKAAEQAHIPHFGIANDHNVSKGDYNFLHWTPIADQAKLLVQELTKRGLHKVAIFEEINDATAPTVAAFKNLLPGTGIQVVWEDSYAKDTADFRTPIAQMKAAKPDVVMLEAFSPMIEIIAGQLKEQGVKIPVTSITYIGTAQHLDVFNGDWFASGGLPNDDFAAKFTAQAGYAPTIGAHYGYDIARIYFTVFENAKDISGTTIKDAIKSFDFSKFDSVAGITGMDADGQLSSAAALVIIKDGKQTALK